MVGVMKDKSVPEEEIAEFQKTAKVFFKYFMSKDNYENCDIYYQKESANHDFSTLVIATWSTELEKDANMTKEQRIMEEEEKKISPIFYFLKHEFTKVKY